MFDIINVSINTNQMYIKNNNVDEGEYTLDPKLTRDVGKQEENCYFTKLTLKIKNTEENPFPVDLEVSLSAVFELKNVEDENNVFDFLKKQGVHILYPYIRSTVSTLTTTAMVQPVILPVVNAFALFD